LLIAPWIFEPVQGRGRGEKAGRALKRGDLFGCFLVFFVGQRLSSVSLVGGVGISYLHFIQFCGQIFLLLYKDLWVS
jgi:hypothetical protein